MTGRKPTREFLEFRDSAWDMLKNTPQARAVDFETLDAVKAAPTPRELILVLRGTISRYGILGEKKENLREIISFLENMK